MVVKSNLFSQDKLIHNLKFTLLLKLYDINMLLGDDRARVEHSGVR